MVIKYPALLQHLKKSTKPIYVLTGLDPYLLNDAVLNIKKAWRQQGEIDEKIIHINTPADWKSLQDEANSYSLFADLVLLDIRFDKKTMDATGKEAINQYLQNINSRSFIILQLSAVPAKQLQWLSNNEHVVLVQILPFSENELRHWIASQLTKGSITYHPDVPHLIYQYAQGNMLACAQVIEKLSLSFDKSQELTVADVEPQLIDQCDFELYELADACLASKEEKTLHLLRHAHNTRAEPTLILWLLTQEIRQLIQLLYLQKQDIPFSTACGLLKIWPKRTKLYETALARLSLAGLYQLLQVSRKVDEQIKTTQAYSIWYAIEKLALLFCWGDKNNEKYGHLWRHL